jgi:hypothetical protein
MTEDFQERPNRYRSVYQECPYAEMTSLVGLKALSEQETAADAKVDYDWRHLARLRSVWVDSVTMQDPKAPAWTLPMARQS